MQDRKITQPAAGGRNLGCGEPDSEKAALYDGGHHHPAPVTDDLHVYQENFNEVLERTIRELNGESCI